MKLRKIVSAISVAVMAGALMTGCGGGGGSSETGPSASEILSKSQEVILQNAMVARAAYSDAHATAVELQTAIATFAASPTQDNLNAAKKAWLIAREAYGPTEVYRFRASPIDSTDYATAGIDNANEEGPEGDINAWPLGEALIDYTVTGNDFDGAADGELGVTANGVGLNSDGSVLSGDDNIISTFTAAQITEDLISNTATAEDEHDVIAGYHAIEFLLWGQDLGETVGANTNKLRNDAVKIDYTTAGGQRALSDFTTDANADRRLKYLQVAADKLVADLAGVLTEWQDNGAYFQAFTTAADQNTANQKLIEIMTGMGKLSFGELASERMLVALRQDSQEDEHSCFSDNTHRDVALNAQGVEIAYFGDYKGYDRNLDGVIDASDGTGVANATTGAGFDELLALVDKADVAQEFETLLDATATGYTAIDASAREGKAFDMQIGESIDQNNKVFTTAMALIDQGLFIQDELTEAMDIDADINSQDGATCDDQGNCNFE
ncbi:imelysin family protein [Thiomicrorhabdus sp.]|uniref:imelysin family protein n=1 Tax=Thiomicrorhabdus sp. TaxID=2039724 RepID=UPI0029C637B1|nr:imelysin family protein [Thiomicrorhabdus sp.]